MNGMLARENHPAIATRYSTAVDSDGRQTWTLAFPAPAKLMSANTVKHWRATGPAKKAWRDATYQHAIAAKLPKGLARVRVAIEMLFPTGCRRDASNYHPYVAKPIVDALGPSRAYTISKGPRRGIRVVEAGYGLIPDDDATHLEGPHLTFGEPLRSRASYGAVVVTITDLSPI